MKLYKTRRGAVIDDEGKRFLLPGADWDFLTDRDGLEGWLRQAIRGAQPVPASANIEAEILPPIGTQEVWAAGVTLGTPPPAQRSLFDDLRHDTRTDVSFIDGHAATLIMPDSLDKAYVYRQ
jgi:prepilin-type processing-associated H-X9-DG protein